MNEGRQAEVAPALASDFRFPMPFTNWNGSACAAICRGREREKGEPQAFLVYCSGNSSHDLNTCSSRSIYVVYMRQKVFMKLTK